MSSMDVDYETKKGRSSCFKFDFLEFLLILLDFFHRSLTFLLVFNDTVMRKKKRHFIPSLQAIMRNLVRRYVTQEQRKAENEGVTEDDVNEIKNDISAFRFGI